MEYKKILEELDKINVSKDVKVILKNPIEKYNFFVSLYNSDINKVNGIPLTLISFQIIYSIVFWIQNYIINFLIIFILIPAIIIILKHFVWDDDQVSMIIFSIYNSILCLICIISYLIRCLSKMTIKKNIKNVSNPFQNMVYYPDLCVQKNVINEYIEINCEGINNNLARFGQVKYY